MGCSSSTQNASPKPTNKPLYPKQNTTPNQNALYNDTDASDDIPPPAASVNGKPQSQPQPAATDPYAGSGGNGEPEPAPAPTMPEPPTPEPKPIEKETEDKVIDARVVKPPTEDDMDDVDPQAGAVGGDITDGIGSKLCMGRQTTVLDTRPGAENRTGTPRPKVAPGEQWVDDSFSVQTAFEGNVSVDWKRPGEIAENPCLFSEGTTRFDIGQGSAGTCWFLSVVAAIADKEDILRQVIPDDAYNIGTPIYDGVFHCRFWKFGEWVDMYIDDYVPVRKDSNTPWGAKSSTDENEMWVTLLEKAFAKFQGSYLKAEGGWAGDAFIHLTGGSAEKLEIKSLQSKDLYSRIRNALMSGSVIACSVPKDKDGQKGLVGGHAYTLTGATTVNPTNSSKKVPLFRVRNPWGGEKGEWTGDYSDKSPKWNNIEDSVKDKLNIASKGDGEFWMPIVDYYTYYSDTHVCNFTPDFDQDGKEDNLDKVSCIFGEWKGETAAGKEMERKMKNQRFTFTVPKKGLESDGMMPVVLQFFQHRENRKEGNMFYIRADLYKVEQQFKKETLCLALDELTNNTTFWGGFNLSYRYKLEPGEYLIVPTTMEAGHEKEFLIRLFSTSSLPCKEIKENPSVFIRRFETTNVVSGKTITTAKLQHVCGLWKAGKNAGGQVKHKSFCNNPQYYFEIKGGETVPLMVSLKQQLRNDKSALGFKIYKTEQLIKSPLDINYLWKNYQTGTQNTVEGNQIFIQGFEGAGLFMLKPGAYVILIFLEEPDNERRYVLSTGTPEKHAITLKSTIAAWLPMGGMLLGITFIFLPTIAHIYNTILLKYT